MGRICDLPTDVISCVLDRLELRDAVRTSALASSWRYHWRYTSAVKFNEVFYRDLPKRWKCESRFIKVLNSISVQHIGGRRGTKSLYLFIPYAKNPRCLSFYRKLILKFVNRGYVDVPVVNSSVDKVYSPFYDFPRLEAPAQLKRLHLDTCSLSQLADDEFPNLETLIILDAPVWEKGCVEQLVRNSPNLDELVIDNSYDKTSGIDLVSPPKLTVLRIDGYLWSISILKAGYLRDLELRLYASFLKDESNIDCMEFTRVENLSLSSEVFEVLSTQSLTRPLSFPDAKDVAFITGGYTINTLQAACNLLRCCGNMEKYTMTTADKILQPFEWHVQTVLPYLPDLTRLRYVTLKDIVGRDNELHFVERLLQCAPKLVKMTVVFGEISEQSLMVANRDLMRMQRLYHSAAVLTWMRYE